MNNNELNKIKADAIRSIQLVGACCPNDPGTFCDGYTACFEYISDELVKIADLVERGEYD